MKRLIFQSRLICFKIKYLWSEGLRKLPNCPLENYTEKVAFLPLIDPRIFGILEVNETWPLFWEVNVLLSFLSALIMGIVVKRFIKGVFLTPFFIQICIMVEKSSKLHFRARDLNRWKPMKNSLKCSSLPSQWWREGSPAFSCRVGLKLLLMLPQVLQFRCPVHKKFWLPVFIRASPRE